MSSESLEILDLILTIRKQAPNNKVFILTSMSRGNWMQKLLASVKHFFKQPLRCFMIRPIGFPPFMPFT